jgi:polysaccharide export outer membrane protein
VAVLCLTLVALLPGCNNSSPETAGQSYAAGNSSTLAQASAPYIATTTPGAAGYKIGPLDVLDVTVFKVPELGRSVQVATNGAINLPLIGDVHASGKTPSALERDIAAKYNAGYINSAHVTVFVKEYNSSRVTVDGAVREPGVYPTRGHDTLMGAISLAKGLDKETASTEVMLFQANEDGTRSAARYDIATIRSGKQADPAIHPGDVIVVEDSAMKATFTTFAKILPIGSPLTYLLVAL